MPVPALDHLKTLALLLALLPSRPREVLDRTAGFADLAVERLSNSTPTQVTVGWEEALREGVLTSPERRVYPDGQTWQRSFEQAKVHIQWDPERNLRGQKLEYGSIQVGISRFLIETFVKDWILEIKDYTPLVKKIHGLCRAGKFDNAKRLLPPERRYELPEDIRRRIGADG